MILQAPRLRTQGPVLVTKAGRMENGFDDEKARSQEGLVCCLCRSSSIMERENFTKTEAEAWLYRRVRALVDFPSAPRGATGQVAGIEETARDHFSLIIERELPGRGQARRDWVRKDEFEQHLIEA